MRQMILAVLLAAALVVPGVASAERASGEGPLDPTGALRSYAPLLQPQREAMTEPRAAAATVSLTQYSLPVEPTNALVAPDGLIWFSSFAGRAIGSLDPGTLATRLYPLPQPKDAFGLARDASGAIWYTTANAAAGNDSIGRLNTVSGALSEWTLPRNHFGLRVDPGSQSAWFVSKGTPSDNLARLVPQTNEMTRWNLNPYTDTYDLDLAPTGDVWFTVQPRGLQGIGRLTPGTGQTTVWTMPTANSRPFQILVANASEIWLTEFGDSANSISRFNPQNGRLSRYALPVAGAAPAGLERSSLGLWFTEYAGSRIGFLSPGLASPQEWTLQSVTFTAAATASTITPSVVIPDIKKSTSVATRFDVTRVVSGAFTHFVLPSAGGLPLGIATSGSAVWVAESGAKRISALRVLDRAVYLPLVERR